MHRLELGPFAILTLLAATCAPTDEPSAPRGTLGTSRASVIDLFTESGLGFSFRSEETLDDGSIRVMGLSENEQVLIELIGPASELTEASIVAEVTTGDARNSTLNAIALAGLLRHIFPRWDDSTEWLTNAMTVAQSGISSSTTVEGIPISFTYQQAIGMAVLTLN